MSNTGFMVRPSASARLMRGIPQDVLFEDNTIDTIVTAPGETVGDVLERRGDTRDFIVVPRRTHDL